MLKKARRLTSPAPARRDAPFRGQGRSSAADPRFTFHAAEGDARKPLAAFFSILLEDSEEHVLVNGRTIRSSTITRWTVVRQERPE